MAAEITHRHILSFRDVKLGFVLSEERYLVAILIIGHTENYHHCLRKCGVRSRAAGCKKRDGWHQISRLRPLSVQIGSGSGSEKSDRILDLEEGIASTMW